MAKFVLKRVEIIEGKGKKCWLPAFSLFHSLFSNVLLSSTSLKFGTVWERVKHFTKQQNFGFIQLQAFSDNKFSVFSAFPTMSSEGH